MISENKTQINKLVNDKIALFLTYTCVKIVCYNIQLTYMYNNVKIHLIMSLSIQENETLNKIRSLYMEGKEYKQIRAELEIPEGTWDNYYYLNKNGFRDWLQQVKKEYFINQAEAFSKKLLACDEQDDARMYAIKQKEVEFLRETLGKDNYSKKTEVDNTTPITINVKSYNENTPALSQPLDKPVKQLSTNNDVAQHILSDTVKGA